MLCEKFRVIYLHSKTRSYGRQATRLTDEIPMNFKILKIHYGRIQLFASFNKDTAVPNAVTLINLLTELFPSELHSTQNSIPLKKFC